MLCFGLRFKVFRVGVEEDGNEASRFRFRAQMLSGV